VLLLKLVDQNIQTSFLVSAATELQSVLLLLGNKTRELDVPDLGTLRLVKLYTLRVVYRSNF
jgi:hypothetical protein